ncbi:hypothetical protein ACWC0A_25570 [Streptomyces scopuliridis]
MKLRAVRVVEAIGAWSAGRGGATAAKKRVAALGAAPSLVDQAGALLSDAPEAALQVIDAQYGGILADSASVLVVCGQWTPGHAIDGHKVVDPATSRRLVESFMRDAAAAGSYNVGGPVRVSGGAPGRFFTDNTHHDHVHAGFTT